MTSFAYDPVGNRTSMTTYLGTTTSTYDPADRLTSSSGPGATTYTYDPNGNQLSAGSTTYAYDLADRMVSATVGSTTETYTWSGDGIRRSAATGSGAATTNFLVDRSFALPEVAVMRDGTGKLLRDAIYGLGRISVVDAAGGIAYQHADALGSVTDRTSSSGVSLAWSEYAPYGALRSAGSMAGVPADPFAFTGQYRDATTGLYHLRARQYDPGTGRFLSTDPVAAAIGDPYVASYVYAGNNPGLLTDPSGRCPWCAVVVGAIVGGVAGTVGYAASALAPGGPGLDLGQAGIAFATGAAAGAACVATLLAVCGVASATAAVVQYGLSPGEKTAVGFVASGFVGAAVAPLSWMPYKAAAWQAWTWRTIASETFGAFRDRPFTGSFARSLAASGAVSVVQRALGATAFGDQGK